LENNIRTRTLRQGRGLDHGVFVPFKLMFPNPCPIPIVEVSMDASLDPQRLLKLGRALSPLRDEGIAILSGGLTIHTFKEWNAWDPKTAPQGFKDWERSVCDSVRDAMSPTERNENLKALVDHPFFRRAHPREEHFVPIYIAAGAGSEEGDRAAVLADIHSAVSIAFGV
jgi:aromatic ring-opening dioxygenase catalytic subunit (LigB family)